MSEAYPKLAKAPIVEAVVDFDCDMPPGLDLAALEGAVRAEYGAEYPKLQRRTAHEYQFLAEKDAVTKHSANHRLQALQCMSKDGKQLVQVRDVGFSFNRLAPYSTLDDYLPAIQTAWNSFCKLAAPVQVRVVRLRYINRMLLPIPDGGLNLAEYLKLSPQLPDDKLKMSAFLNQYAAVEPETGHDLMLVMTSQPPEAGGLPVILDNCVGSRVELQPGDWAGLHNKLEALRKLKNRVFFNVVTPKCINLFQH